MPTAATVMPLTATHQRTRLCKAVWTSTLTAKIWQQMDAALECKDIAASLVLVALQVLPPPPALTPVAVLQIQLQLRILQHQRIPVHATPLATVLASYQVTDVQHVASAVVE